MRDVKAKRLLLVSLALLLMLALVGCGKSAPAEAPRAESETPQPTAEATPPAELRLGSLTVSPDAESLDLAGTGATLEDLMSLSGKLDNVREISVGVTNATIDQLRAVAAAFPQAELSWSAELLGREVDCRAESVDLSDATDGDLKAILAALPLLPELKTLELAPPEDGVTGLSFESLSALAQAAPELELNCRFELFGQTADWTTEKLKYYKTEIGNEGIEIFREALPYLRSLDLLRLESCGITDYDAMDALRSDFPDKRVVWSVSISGHIYTTDTTLINDGDTGILNDDNVYLLQYMHDVLYLDLGHYGHITNIEFVRNFPKLQVLITTLSKVGDLSPLEDCPDLEFLECHGTPLGDISVLADKDKLEYLNISNLPNLTDLSPLYGLKQLKIVRICGSTFTHITMADVAKLKEELPDTFVSDYGGDPNSSGQWRYNTNGNKSDPTERYKLLREQMLYDLPMWERISNSPSKEE